MPHIAGLPGNEAVDKGDEGRQCGIAVVVARQPACLLEAHIVPAVTSDPLRGAHTVHCYLCAVEACAPETVVGRIGPGIEHMAVDRAASYYHVADNHFLARRTA